MKTFATRALAVSGALVIGLGAAGCSKSETPPTGSRSPSAAASPGTSTTSAAGSAGASSATTSATSTATTSAAPSAASAATSGAGGAPQAPEILSRAKASALAAKSGAFVGQVDQGGRTIRIEFKGTSDGRTADITIDTGGDGRARVISLADAVYIQADAEFWKKQGAPPSVQKADGKFIKAPGSAGAMTQSLSLKTFLERAFAAVKPSQLATDVASGNADGVPCWVLTDKKGKAEGALYVSKETFEVVRFTGSSASPGRLDFSRWNEDLGITAPAASDVMTIR